jgi:hypothetical protein
MKYKDNWPEAKDRWTALWEGRYIERPCITVQAPRAKRRESPKPVSGEQKWLDPDFIVRTMLAEFESTYYGGEAFPSYLLMAGWIVNTYGTTPRFPMETIWIEPMTVDWENPPTFEFDWESPWFKKVVAIHKAVLAAAGRDNFLVGRGCLLPGNDLLPLFIGSQEFLMCLNDRPEWARAAILKLAQNQVAVRHYFHKLHAATTEFWYGNAGWMPFWAPEPYATTQSDISCMLSPAMFDEFVLPELDLLGREFKWVWYHLDGQSAFQHLPRLLSLPYLKVVQFTPEAATPPNGPAHLDLYRKIQAAGKIVHIELPPQNIEPLARELDPGLICFHTSCNNVQEADELLATAKRWVRPAVA